MCGRFANHVSDMHRWINVLSLWPGDLTTGFNVAPTQMAPVLTTHGNYAMRWGLVPAWSKEASPKYATFNARLETVAEKPAFRDAWKQKRRCAVPIRGYYEWKTAPGGKQPYFVCDAQERGPLVMAGLWEEREGGLSFTVLTEPANGRMVALHHRMPVMLTPDTAPDWLAGEGALEPAEQEACRVDMKWYPVGREVGNAGNQGEHLIIPLPGPDQAK